MAQRRYAQCDRNGLSSSGNRREGAGSTDPRPSPTEIAIAMDARPYMETGFYALADHSMKAVSRRGFDLRQIVDSEEKYTSGG